MTAQQRPAQGFTLIELAVVLIIIGILTGAMASVAGIRIDVQRISNTKEHLQFLQDALNRYVKRYGHLPCPADPTQAPGTTLYGVGQGTNQATDTNADGFVDTPGCTGAGVIAVAGASHVFIGSIPFKELDINGQVALDGWENLLTYAVDGDLTFIGNGWDASTPRAGYTNNGNPEQYDNQADPVNRSNQGDIQILNAVGTIVADHAAYVVLSHGADGWGAYTRDGNYLGIGTASTQEQENINTLALNDANFLVSMPTKVFDDILIYQTKWMIDRK